MQIRHDLAPFASGPRLTSARCVHGRAAEITEFLPPKAFAFREHDEQTGTHELRFELAPDGGGCRLTFAHSVTEAFAETPWAGQAETGWVHCLDALTRALAEAARRPDAEGVSSHSSTTSAARSSSTESAERRMAEARRRALQPGNSVTALRRAATPRRSRC